MSEKPRIRVLANGWIRHEGKSMPIGLRPDDRVEIAVRAGNAAFIQGWMAQQYMWLHTGFSGDIIAYRPKP
jgi:hypothetical protein